MKIFSPRIAKYYVVALSIISCMFSNSVLSQPASKGYVDGLSGTAIVGWACTVGYAESVDVHVYIGGYAGNYGALLANGIANNSSDGAVEAECASGYYYHRFSVDLSHILRFGGQPIYVHGINEYGGISVPITNSGTFTVPNPIGRPATPTNFDMDVTVDTFNGIELREFEWDPVPGATIYIVSQLRGDTAHHVETFVTGTTFGVFKPIGSPDRYMVAACTSWSEYFCGKYSSPIYAD